MEDRYEGAKMHCERGLTLYRRDRFNDAITEFTRAIRLYPNARCYSNRGVAYGQLGKYNEAIAYFEEALELDPGNASYLDNLAKAERALALGW